MSKFIAVLPGQYFDKETYLNYNWHRYYDPFTGRYISADPIGLDGGNNLYLYADANPINNIDPEGLTWKHKRPGREYEDILEGGGARGGGYPAVANPSDHWKQ